MIFSIVYYRSKECEKGLFLYLQVYIRADELQQWELQFELKDSNNSYRLNNVTDVLRGNVYSKGIVQRPEDENSIDMGGHHSIVTYSIPLTKQ